MQTGISVPTEVSCVYTRLLTESIELGTSHSAHNRSLLTHSSCSESLTSTNEAKPNTTKAIHQQHTDTITYYNSKTTEEINVGVIAGSSCRTVVPL